MVSIFREPFRHCNLKSYSCEFRNNLSAWDYSEKEKVEKKYFQNKLYKKGQLKLLDISEQKYQKLSLFAKKYFIQGFDKYDKRGNPIFIYHPNIPKTYVREYEEKLFWNRLYIPNSAAQSEEKRLENWLDYKKECELWHYEGYRVHYYDKWKQENSHKQIRENSKKELAKAKQDFLDESIR